jgi:hypothetical protein
MILNSSIYFEKKFKFDLTSRHRTFVSRHIIKESQFSPLLMKVDSHHY